MNQFHIQKDAVTPEYAKSLSHDLRSHAKQLVPEGEIFLEWRDLPISIDRIIDEKKRSGIFEDFNLVMLHTGGKGRDYHDTFFNASQILLRRCRNAIVYNLGPGTVELIFRSAYGTDTTTLQPYSALIRPYKEDGTSVSVYAKIPNGTEVLVLDNDPDA